jgi:YfiH family protein
VPLERLAQHLFTSKQLRLPEPSAWRLALDSLGADETQLRRIRQVHGREVFVIRRGDAVASEQEERPEADAIVSNQPGLVLAVMVADCVPMLLADTRHGAAAAVHAGWRGTCARVAEAAVSTMHDAFGSRPDDLVAAIGPSIGPEDYEVGEALMTAFLDAGHSRAEVQRWFSVAGEKPHLDLWTANREQLLAAGVRADRLHTCGLSTLNHREAFHSYRADGDRAGRMAALIAVPAERPISRTPTAGLDL